jgi:outer membrane immunogenic protein
MKKILIASIAAAAFCGAPAIAADMPTKGPVYKAAPAPVFNWTGFYAGIEGGGGWGHEHWNDNTAPGGGNLNFKPDGGVFGGQVGYRWQANQFVFGIEGTGAWADLMSQTVASGAFTEKFKVKSLYTVTGQVGWAMDRSLAYVKGGWAGAPTNVFFNEPGILTGSRSQDANGWTIGGGLDYAVSPNWILGVEYDHFNLKYGAFTTPTSIGGAPFIITNTSRLTIDQVVARLSYKFN